MVPVLIEVLCLPIIKIPVVIVAIHVLAQTFLYYFTSLIIKHALVTCFLQTCASVGVDLLPFYYSVVIANSTCCLCLVRLLHWPSVLVHLG